MRKAELLHEQSGSAIEGKRWMETSKSDHTEYVVKDLALATVGLSKVI